MYAVPLVSGVFVKGGRKELSNVIDGSWQQFSTRLAGSMAAFARSLQAQTYVRDQRFREFHVVAQALNDIASSEETRKNFEQFVLTQSLGAAANQLIQDNKAPKTLNAADPADFQKCLVEALQQQKRVQVLSAITAYAAYKGYESSISARSFHAAESAHAARFYSHDAAQNLPGSSLFAAQVANNYLNTELATGSWIDFTVKIGLGATRESISPSPGGPRNP